MNFSYVFLWICLLSGFATFSSGQEAAPNQPVVKVDLAYYHTSPFHKGFSLEQGFSEQERGICQLANVTSEKADLDTIYRCNKTSLAGATVLTDGEEGAIIGNKKMQPRGCYVFDPKTKPVVTFENPTHACISTIVISFYEDREKSIFVPQSFKLRSSNTSMFKEMSDLPHVAMKKSHPSVNHTTVVSLHMEHQPACDRYIKVKFAKCAQLCNDSSLYYVSEMKVFALMDSDQRSNTTFPSENSTTISPTLFSFEWLFQVPYIKYTIAMIVVVAVVLSALLFITLACIVTSCRRYRRRKKMAKMNPAIKDYAALEFLPIDNGTGVMLTSVTGTSEKGHTVGQPTEHVVVTVETAGKYVDQGPCALDSPNSPPSDQRVRHVFNGNTEEDDPPTSTSMLDEPFGDISAKQTPNSSPQTASPAALYNQKQQHQQQRTESEVRYPRRSSRDTSQTVTKDCVSTPVSASQTQKERMPTPDPLPPTPVRLSPAPVERSQSTGRQPSPLGEEVSQALARQYADYDQLPSSRGRVRIPTTSDGYAYLAIIKSEGDTLEKRRSLDLPSRSDYANIDIKACKEWLGENRRSLDLRTRYGYANVDIIDAHQPIDQPQEPAVTYGLREYAEVVLPNDGEDSDFKQQQVSEIANHSYTEIDVSEK